MVHSQWSMAFLKVPVNVNYGQSTMDHGRQKYQVGVSFFSLFLPISDKAHPMIISVIDPEKLFCIDSRGRNSNKTRSP